MITLLQHFHTDLSLVLLDVPTISRTCKNNVYLCNAMSELLTKYNNMTQDFHNHVLASIDDVSVSRTPFVM